MPLNVFYCLFMAVYRYTQIDSLSSAQKLFAPRQTTHTLSPSLLRLPPAAVASAGTKHRPCVFLVLTLAQYVCMILFYFYLPHFPSKTQM